ncbi:MAG: hypothetical protein JST26_14000 [Bacteroidetes bacterium]|nr:hypothetical protein [Bacteroidota bacterium]
MTDNVPVSTLLLKGTWLVLLHANRVPPHVGFMADGNYNSLTIKGHELDVKLDVLLKTIQQKKIETVFLQLRKHPVFSNDHQLHIFQHQVQQFQSVKPYEATCLSPLKLFFQEFYALPLQEEELLFDMVRRLEENDYLGQRIFINIDEKSMENGKFSLPEYSSKQLQEVIRKEREAFYKD